MKMKSKNLHLSAMFVLTEKRHYLRAFIKRSASSRGVSFCLVSDERERGLSVFLFVLSKKEFTTGF